MALLQIEAASRFYELGETRVEALRSVSLEFAGGEFVAICGPSGSGKSTLCNLIAGIDHPDTGDVRFEGRSLASLGEPALAAHRNAAVGLVFQSFNLVPVLSALENVMLPLQFRGVASAEARESARRELEAVGLESHAGHLPDKLSGGQRQRVAIARALITRPRLLVADEPTANLDTDNASRILDLMLRLNEVEGTTFIISTHDERLLNRMRRVVRLEDGRVVEDCVGEAQKGEA
ncbi:ABC transporter ATP-binding protein [Coraliomargarita parva]|uniref:ABC transporter ATP-binding protein n=1 Tax=Coraliomargarita parva TaxID=3014050 RepID=UPI0022B3F412|nr:ABC transporter ATP-binding protein [Coraliomargarita parva]